MNSKKNELNERIAEPFYNPTAVSLAKSFSRHLSTLLALTKVSMALHESERDHEWPAHPLPNKVGYKERLTWLPPLIRALCTSLKDIDGLGGEGLREGNREERTSRR